jgi:hypothetical protein
LNARAWLRAGLGFLAFTQFVPFGWALLAPRSFYDAFPFGAPGWVALLPPFNEHLVRDVGGLGVALGIVLAGAAVLARRDVTRLVVVAFLVFDIPHAVFHSLHLHGFATVDAVAQSAAFAVQILVAVALFVLAGRVPEEHHAARTG